MNLPASPRLLPFRAALALLCAGSIFQSVLGLFRPDLVSAHRQLLNAALSTHAGINMAAGSVPAFELYLESAVCLAAVGLALALVWRVWHRPDARMLALFLSTAFFPAMSAAWAGVPYSALVLVQGAVQWVYVAAFIRFAAQFPRPLVLADLEAADAARAARKGRVAKPVGRGRRMLLQPRAVWAGTAVIAVVAVLSTAAKQPIWQVVLMPFLLWGLVRGVGLLRASYAVADPVGQRRILWVVQGLYSMLWLGVVMLGAVGYGMLHGARAAAAGIPASQVQVPVEVMMVANVTQSISTLVVVVCLAIAIFFHGALDPRLALRRTTIYAGVALTGALLFGVVENAASAFLADVLHLSEGLGAAVAGAAVALAFGPLRGWLTRVVESRLTLAAPVDEPAGELSHA